MAKLNYCIIKGEKDQPTIVYVANNDDTRLDASVMDHEHFNEIKEILEFHGFEHVVAMTFKNKFNTSPKLKFMISDLRDHGFIRSRKLEAYVNEQRERQKALKMLPNPLSGFTQTSTSIPLFSSSSHGGLIHYTSPNTKLRRSERPTSEKFHTVGIGEKIELYVYLFLRVNPTEDKSIDFDFDCDFYSKDNNELRRFIKMIKCSFVRKESDTAGIMYLESEQTLRDILKEVDFLFFIRLVDPFDLMSGQRPKSMVFSSIELKEYIHLDQKISLFLNIDERYLEVISLSEKIKNEKKEYDHNTQVPVALIKKATMNVLKRMEQRMHYYSDEENYELAASYRKNQEYIQSKIDILLEYEKDGIEFLTNPQYESDFTMKDMDF